MPDETGVFGALVVAIAIAITTMPPITASRDHVPIPIRRPD